MKIVGCTFELICLSVPQNDRKYLPVACILSRDNIHSVRNVPFCTTQVKHKCTGEVTGLT